MPRTKKPSLVVEKTEAFEDIAPKYKVTMTFNDKTHTFETNDLFTSIMDRKPTFLKTRILFTVINEDGKKFEKLLFVFGGKMIFRNPLSLRIFINNMRFK